MFFRFIQAISGRAPDPLVAEADRLQGKLATAARGRFFRALEGTVDAESLGILEQELREADAAVKAATRELAGLMAREMADARALAGAETRAAEYEGYARKALQAGEERLAERTAERVAQAEAERERLREAVAAAREEIEALRSEIGEAERRLLDMRRELAAARSREALGRSIGVLGSQADNATAWLAEAEDTLTRIRALHGNRADRRAAMKKLAEEKSGGTLDAELERAGFKDGAKHTARAVLDRLRGSLTPPPATPSGAAAAA
jgi:phage shock protein A